MQAMNINIDTETGKKSFRVFIANFKVSSKRQGELVGRKEEGCQPKYAQYWQQTKSYY